MELPRCCCKEEDEQEAEEREDDQFARCLAPIRPFDEADVDIAAHARPQIFILGAQGSGKTVLFNRLVYPQVSADDCVGIISDTSTFHVEPAMFGGRSSLMWDISGDPVVARCGVEAMCSCETRGIIWVVPMLDVKKETVARAKRSIEDLLATESLSRSFFILMFNTYDLYADESAPYELTERGEDVLRSLIQNFDLSTVVSSYPARVTWGVVNVKMGFADPRLVALCDWAGVYMKYH